MEKETKQTIIKILEEIKEGMGPFDRDPIQHAENTIEAMKELAQSALDILTPENNLL